MNIGTFFIKTNVFFGRRVFTRYTIILSCRNFCCYFYIILLVFLLCSYNSYSFCDICFCRFAHIPPKSKRRKALGRAPAIGRPRLFGGTIEEYVEVSVEPAFFLH